MLTLSAKIRTTFGKKVKFLGARDVLPAVLYGPKIKNASLEINLKEFEKIYKEAGESTLISLVLQNFSKKNLGGLDIQGEKSAAREQEKPLVLIHEVKLDPLTLKPIHVDFYQPSLEEEVEATVPIVFKGESPVVKELGGTLVKNISEVEVEALPQNLPHEIIANVELLKNFEDHILIKDLKVPEGVKILKEPEEIVALVSAPEKVEEELEKPIEEKVEEVERVKEKKEEEEEEEEKEKK